jgi:predicted alpha/beta superfamily hydrolase
MMLPKSEPSPMTAMLDLYSSIETASVARSATQLRDGKAWAMSGRPLMNSAFQFGAVMLCCTVAVLSASPVLKDVDFSVTHDAGFGNEVCVLGDHPLLGGNDPLRAVKLVWSEGNVWRGAVALPAGETLSYRFIRRSFSTADWGNPANAAPIGDALTVVVPPHAPAPWPGKNVLLHSTWTQANIFYRDLSSGGDWTTKAMTLAGAGRSGSEKLFRVELPLAPGAEMEFVFNDGTNWLNAPAPPSNTPQGAAPAVPAPYQGLTGPLNFRTTLDQFFVQDGSVFNYRPPATVSAPRFVTRDVGSTVNGIPGRPVTILLPRGYDQNTWKRYPVVYFHDGQNVFFPGGAFGTWDADRIAGYETSQGRMREAIMVAIPNGNGYGSNRLEEYLPEGDSIVYLGAPYSGKAAAYAQWLLDNVAPTLDFNFRTRGGAGDTLSAGSSMGGLVSDYLGVRHGDRFGTVGIFSPAYWAADNYMAGRTIGAGTARSFLSMGTAESSSGESSSNVYWQDAVASYGSYVRGGHAANADVLFAGAAGGLHNEPAWARLLPRFFAWALDPWREANPLALELHPPEMTIAEGNKGSLQLRRSTRRGFAQELVTSTDLTQWTTNAVISPDEAWDAVTNEFTPTARQFWRLRTVSQ